MVESLVDIVRRYEGQFDISESAQTISIPRLADSPMMTGEEPCVFARLVSYMSSKLYNCVSPQACASQVRYGTPRVYCRKELDK